MYITPPHFIIKKLLDTCLVNNGMNHNAVQLVAGGGVVGCNIQQVEEGVSGLHGDPGQQNGGWYLHINCWRPALHTILGVLGLCWTTAYLKHVSWKKRGSVKIEQRMQTKRFRDCREKHSEVLLCKNSVNTVNTRKFTMLNISQDSQTNLWPEAQTVCT